jgi:hypothetical protein
MKVSYVDPTELKNAPVMNENFRRQRERFFHAEALRNFARDTVPDGTFASLQEEILHGVIDVCEIDHSDGFARMSAVVTQAAALPLVSSALASVTRTQDKQGICHQLANVDKLTWVKGESDADE